ncbi:MAG: nucleotidyltransferase [Chloroflexi bacterium]|nr:nucleotidyltransferase [Chloroflexota bacterium]
MHNTIDIPAEQIEEFSKKYHIRKLSLFGSILRADFRPDSDIDVLVEFDPQQVPGFITLGAMHVELEEILGRMVDIRTYTSLSTYFRDNVLKHAQVLYERI